MKLELIPVTSYLPDIDLLQKHKNKLCFAASDWSIRKQVWFSEVATNLSELIGCGFIVLPGGHISFIDKSKAWAKIIDSVL